MYGLHEDTAVGLIYSYTHPFGTVAIAFESISENMSNLLSDLVRIYLGLKMRFTLNCTISHLEREESKTVPFLTPYITLLHPSKSLVDQVILTGANYITASLNTYSSHGTNCSSTQFRKLIYFLELIFICFRLNVGA